MIEIDVTIRPVSVATLQRAHGKEMMNSETKVMTREQAHAFLEELLEAMGVPL